MFRSILAVLSLMVGTYASANTLTDVMARAGQQIVMSDVQAQGLNMKKGDQASYKLNVGGFINGTMIATVDDVIAEGIWIHQDMDLGFAGKQDIKELIDPNTGEIKKMIVNGKEQAPPQSTVEVIETKEDKVTVPAGTFTCLYIKAKMTSDGNTSEAEQWINPKEVPVFGLVKMITSSQMGPVTVELTSFKRM